MSFAQSETIIMCTVNTQMLAVDPAGRSYSAFGYEHVTTPLDTIVTNQFWLYSKVSPEIVQSGTFRYKYF